MLIQAPDLGTHVRRWGAALFTHSIYSHLFIGLTQMILPR